MDYYVPLEGLTKEYTPITGGKAAMLGELMALAPHLKNKPLVPGGYAITVNAFEEFLNSSELTDASIAKALQYVGRDIPRLEEMSNKITNHLRQVKFPEDYLPPLNGDKLYAVRSSGVDEDGESASFAGQHDSFLNVPASRVFDAVRNVWLSSYNSRALYYRSVKGITEKPIRQGVVIQEMVKPLWAGVAFSADPRTGRTDHGLIEYIDGLGEDLVSGKKTPIFVGFEHNANYHPKKWSSPMIIPLIETLMELQAALGWPVDIEWAWDDQLNLLQARPITTLPKALDDATIAKLKTKNAEWGIALHTGTPLAPGECRAVGFISRTQAVEALKGDVNGTFFDLSKRILLVPYTTPDDLPIMEKVAGIVVSKGGYTSHAAIVCRELGKPCLRVDNLLKLGHNYRSYAKQPILLDANIGGIYKLNSPYDVDTEVKDNA